MLEHHFWENFRKWVPHKDVDEVYDIEEIGFEEEGFVVLLRPDHFQKEKRSEQALRLIRRAYAPPPTVPLQMSHCSIATISMPKATASA